MTRLLIMLAIASIGCSRPIKNDGPAYSLLNTGVPGTTEVVSTGLTSVSSTTAFGPGYIRVKCTQYSTMTVGENPVATGRTLLIGQNVFYHFYFGTAYKVAFLGYMASGKCSISDMRAE